MEKKKKAFTLIELLVVVAIMGLLSAVAVIALNNARARARDARRLSDIKQVQTALELYYLDQNQYPEEAATFEGYCLSSAGIATACTAPTYLAKIPANPNPRTDGLCTDVPYTYTSDLTGNLSYHITYCLGSATGGIISSNHTATPAGITNP